MMGAYGLGPFYPPPYPSYPANVMAAQMNQMQLSGVYGYGVYGGAYGPAGFNTNAQAADLALLPRSQQGQQGQQAEIFELQHPMGEGFSQSSPGPRLPSFPGYKYVWCFATSSWHLCYYMPFHI